jgi:hypothetical protein
VPTDVHFLELNVPIDENFYYANGEQSIQNHFFADMEPPAGTSRSFETPQNGNIMAIGTGAISSTFLPPLEHIQENINYGPMGSSLMVHTAQEKSQYIDFSSSTNSLTILKSCAQQFECGSAKTIVRKSSKPKKKQRTKTKEFISKAKETGIKQTQIFTNSLITETAAEPSSELDKIASRLFSNQSSITLEFNDLQRASEFSTLMSRCSQLMEVSFCFIINMKSIIFYIHTLAKGSRD